MRALLRETEALVRRSTSNVEHRTSNIESKKTLTLILSLGEMKEKEAMR
jgi:hypothetical protein